MGLTWAYLDSPPFPTLSMAGTRATTSWAMGVNQVALVSVTHPSNTSRELCAKDP